MSTKKSNKQDILDYHANGRPGKIEVIPSKPSNTQRDLAIAYSPGVAIPCLEIAENKDKVYNYTAKGNLVAVISNGTAVLGLGNIGPEASKPVMEGKGLLFKIFADIDVFDIELNADDIEVFIQTVKALEPTFGGINLEDIKAPECFEIEARLKEALQIPIMHDDQHGTAIIAGAALINALNLVKKEMSEVKVVFNGAGASAISCAKLFFSLGVSATNLIMCDSKGVINKYRTDLDSQKAVFATNKNINTLDEALINADVFVGLSKGNVVSPQMLLKMADNPVVFALANPDPEIDYQLAIKTRPDIIMATGRSDYPNQVNNVLGFPYIFRGALDVRATQINEAMKLAAVHALAELAKTPVPDIVNQAYNQRTIVFGKDYIIPKPFDPRLITTVAPAVAKAAMDSGVAKKPITNWQKYEEELLKRMGKDDKFMRMLTQRAKQNPKRVVFAEADNYKTLKAATIANEEGIAIPVLLGNKSKIEALAESYVLDIAGLEIIDPRSANPDVITSFTELIYEKRYRKGITKYDAEKLVLDRNYFGACMLEMGMADAFISGLTRKYPETVKPALQIIGMHPRVKRVAGMYIMLTKKGAFFFADTTANVNPTTEDLVDIVLTTARAVSTFNVKPRFALLSYSNFGSNKGDIPDKMAKAVAYLHKNHPDLVVDGELQANFALNPDMLKESFPFSKLVDEPANVFIFPDLASGNIAYKMLQSFEAADAIGPILIGMNKPVHILQLGSSVREILNMVTIAVIDSQTRINK